MRLLRLDHARIKSALRWGGRGFWAVLDQGLFSGSNFLVNILLARWLSPEEYGAFAVTLSVFYLLAGFHTAVLTEPMMVFGAGKYREHFRKYFGILLWGHWAVSALIALAFGVAARGFSRLGSPPMAEALGGLAVAAPFLLLLWLTRRACYAQFRPTWAVVGSGLYFLAILAGLFMLSRWQKISALNGFLLLGTAAGLASLMIIAKLRPQLAGYVGNPMPSVIFRDHRQYGQWSVLEGVAYAGANQLWLIIVPTVLGLGASAALAAVWILYRPFSLLMQTLGLLLLPTFVRWRENGMELEMLRRRVMLLAFSFTGGAVLYVVFLTAIARPLLRSLYQGKYDTYHFLIPLLGATLLLTTFTQVVIAGIKSTHQVKLMPLIWAVSAISIATVVVPLMHAMGLHGAALAYSFGYGTAAVTSVVVFNKALKAAGKEYG